MELHGDNNNEDVKRINRVWEYFVVKDEKQKLATCNICSEDYSFKLLSNLSEHLTKMHNFKKMRSGNIFEESGDLKNSPSSNDETNAESDDGQPLVSKTEELNKSSTRKGASLAWEYFIVANADKRQAQCRLCLQILSFNTSVSNLMKHVRRKHFIGTTKSDDETDAETSKKQNDSKMSDDDNGILELEVGEDGSLLKRKRRSSQRSALWSYFKSINKEAKIALCLLCRKQFRYSGTISNLGRHLERKHPNALTAGFKTENMQFSAGEQSEAEVNGDQEFTDIVVSDPDEIDALVMEDVYVEEYDENVPKKRAADPISIENRNKERQKRKRKMRMQNQVFNKKRLLIDDGDSSDEEVTLQKRYIRKENESVDYFGKYITSLLKQLPKELSDHLQMNFVKQIMEVKMAYKNAVPNADSSNGYSITITTDNSAVVNEEATVTNVSATTE